MKPQTQPAPSNQSETVKEQAKKLENNNNKPKIEVKKFEFKKYLLSILGLMILINLGIVIWLVMIVPQKAKSIQELRTQVLSMQMNSQDEQLLLQALEETQTERDRLATVFPNEESLLQFIHYIDAIRENPKVEVVKFSLNSENPNKIGRNQAFLPITLTLKGQEKEVYQELKNLVNSPYFIRVVTFTQEFVPDTDYILLQTQFHIFVSNEFTKIKS